MPPALGFGLDIDGDASYADNSLSKVALFLEESGLLEPGNVVAIGAADRSRARSRAAAAVHA